MVMINLTYEEAILLRGELAFKARDAGKNTPSREKLCRISDKVSDAIGAPYLIPE